VDNYVDKRLLTSRKRSIGAAFNKMPIQEANFKVLKIKGLHEHLF
jgi:hypothetical protein